MPLAHEDPPFATSPFRSTHHALRKRWEASISFVWDLGFHALRLFVQQMPPTSERVTYVRADSTYRSDYVLKNFDESFFRPVIFLPKETL